MARVSTTATATYSGTYALAFTGSGTTTFGASVKPSTSLSFSGGGSAGFGTISRPSTTATATYSGTFTVPRTIATSTAIYSGSTTARSSINASQVYSGSTATPRISASSSVNYSGSQNNTVTVKASVESGEFFTATGSGVGTWSLTFAPGITPPNKYISISGTTATIYAPPSSTGYAMIVAFGSATASVNVQPTSLDNKAGKPVVIYQRSELPLPFDISVADVVSTMPTTEPTGFTRVFADDFTTAVALGGWPVGAAGSATDGRLATNHPYYAKLNLYPDNQGYDGDLSNGRYYTSKTVSTTTAANANGVLDWYWHSETVDGASRALSGWARPIIPGETSQKRLGGRFSVRMRADSTAGYGAVQLLISDNWPMGGEEDWPEGPSSESPVHGFRHFADPNATAQTSGQYQQQVNTPTGTLWSDWHVYTIEWIPGTRMRYLVDGVAVHDSTDRVPTVPMKYVIQSGINGSTIPSASVSGHLQIDWMTVADYTG